MTQSAIMRIFVWLFFFKNRVSVQAGVDAGCLRCSQLISKGISEIKHKIHCTTKLQSVDFKKLWPTIRTQNISVAEHKDEPTLH